MNDDLQQQMRESIDNELILQVGRLNETNFNEYYEMLSYHLGWSGEGAGENARGKRIRPLILLLCSATGKSGYDWHKSLPAAASIELIHNFSLIHDDIQDNSEKRRNRPTVWRKWGIPQAINAGDGLFVLANLAAMGLVNGIPETDFSRILTILQETCLKLTQGQYLDMSFEKLDSISLDLYWTMIKYKTCQLISASTEIGGILAGFNTKEQEQFQQFGHYLGLAFQVNDDILGIWGDEKITGKSNLSDLVTRKKTLPIIYGIQKSEQFSQLWKNGEISSENSVEMANLLTTVGAKSYSIELADHFSDLAIKYLDIISPSGDAGDALYKITNQLSRRDT